jgi:acetoin utilization deacetylase AcuC-like enzyme
MRHVYLEHPSSLAHDTGSRAHPEDKARITAIERELYRLNWVGYDRILSPPVEMPVLTAVHPESYVTWIREVCARGGGWLDPDTVVSEKSYDAAVHAVGGAVRMAELLVSGEAVCGFSAHRPPGHHATRGQAGGFCLFNNAAVAAKYALDKLGLERVMIFDWDVHHGNGTNDIFHTSNQVVYASIHQWPLYPDSGAADDVGSGEGTGYTVNLPVAPGAGNTLYRSLVSHVIVPLARAFEPQLVLISAGYDAHRDDPLAQCMVTDEGFAAMASAMRRVCHSIKAPLGAVLEGGYSLAALARSVAVTLESFVKPMPTGEVELVPQAAQARSRLAQWWPTLADG